MILIFIDESEDADHVLSQSAFEPVWQVVKALRTHDRRLADELDQLRLSLGKRTKSGGRIKLPGNIKLDVPRLLLPNFEQAFYARTVTSSHCLSSQPRAAPAPDPRNRRSLMPRKKTNSRRRHRKLGRESNSENISVDE